MTERAPVNFFFGSRSRPLDDSHQKTHEISLLFSLDFILERLYCVLSSGTSYFFCISKCLNLHNFRSVYVASLPHMEEKFSQMKNILIGDQSDWERHPFPVSLWGGYICIAKSG